MKTSARNELKGSITEIKAGQVNSEIVMDLGEGKVLKSLITNDAVSEMGLKKGETLYAIIKSSFVLISKDKPGKISARNVLEAKVSDIKKGMVNFEAKLTMGSHTLTTVITEEAAEDLDLKAGDTVYAIIKASSIILAK